LFDKTSGQEFEHLKLTKKHYDRKFEQLANITDQQEEVT
jgi:hypothetical protein